MRGLTGYATLIDPDGPKREADTFICAHCQKIVHVRTREALENLGGRCSVCDGLICPSCVARHACDPFEEKLKRMEARHQARRSYGL